MPFAMNNPGVAYKLAMQSIKNKMYIPIEIGNVNSQENTHFGFYTAVIRIRWKLNWVHNWPCLRG